MVLQILRRNNLELIKCRKLLIRILNFQIPGIDFGKVCIQIAILIIFTKNHLQFYFFKCLFQPILFSTILVISKFVLQFEVIILNKNSLLFIHLNKSVYVLSAIETNYNSDHSFERKRKKQNRKKFEMSMYF